MEFVEGRCWAIAQDGCWCLLSQGFPAGVVSRLYEALRPRLRFSHIMQELLSLSKYSLTDLPFFGIVVRENQEYHLGLRGMVVATGMTASGEFLISGHGVSTWCEQRILDPASLILRQIDSSTNQYKPSQLWPADAAVVRASCLLILSTQSLNNSDQLACDQLEESGTTTIAGAETISDSSSESAHYTSESSNESGGNQASPRAERELSNPICHSPSVLARVCVSCRTPNPTSRVNCRQCGMNLGGDAVRIPRPALGTLLLPFGDTLPLDRPVLIGRKPHPARFPPGDTPVMVQIDDPHVSGTHLRIDLEDWSVLVTNLGRNTTILRRPGQPDRGLSHAEQVITQVGDTYDLGSGTTVTIQELT